MTVSRTQNLSRTSGTTRPQAFLSCKKKMRERKAWENLSHTLWVENFEAIHFHCFRGASLDPRKLNTTNFDLPVQLLGCGVFQVLQACYPATMTGEFSPRPPRFR
jgi:hypothetical protein